MNTETREQPHSGLWDLFFCFLVPGVIQGYGLYLMRLPVNKPYFESVSAPSQLTYSLILFLLLAPAVYFLSSVKGQRFGSIVLAVFIGGLCGYLSFTHLGRFTGNTDAVNGSTWWPVFLSSFGSLVIAATVMPYFRAVTQRRVRFNHYPTLFEYAWNQTAVALIAGLFVGLVFTVLVVAEVLFKTVGVRIGEYIWQPYVVFPVAFGSLALGMGITRENDIDYAQKNVMKFRWLKKSLNDEWNRVDNGVSYPRPYSDIKMPYADILQFFEQLDAGLVGVAPVEVEAIAVGDFILTPGPE